MIEILTSDLQIAKNYLFLFILPFCIGAILRTFFRKKEKGFIVTFVLGVISAIMYFIVYTDSAATVFGIILRESFAFLSMCVVMVFFGSFITEIVLAIIKRKNNKTDICA